MVQHICGVYKQSRTHNLTEVQNFKFQIEIKKSQHYFTKSLS